MQIHEALWFSTRTKIALTQEKYLVSCVIDCAFVEANKLFLIPMLNLINIGK